MNRLWFLCHFEWIFANRHKLRGKICADFVITGFVINAFASPYFSYKIVGDLIELWEKGFIYKGFPLIHYRISHGDSSTNIAYIYRGKIFSHRFLYNDEKKYIANEDVKLIFRKLRKSKL